MIRKMYETKGVCAFYKEYANSYTNPHQKYIEHHLSTHLKPFINGSVLDLCCGSGEVTNAIQQFENVTHIEGTDLYTSQLYKNNTQCTSTNLSFDDILNHGLPSQYDTIICSFALHLCPNSKLPIVLWRLAQSSNTLIILTPHKNPVINKFWKLENEFRDQIRSRVYYNDV